MGANHAYVNQSDLNPQDFSSWPSRLLWIVERFEEGNRSAFAARISVSPQAVHGLLAGSTPRGDTLEAVIRGYPLVNPHWLLTGDGAPMRAGLEPLSDHQKAELREYVQTILRNADAALDVIERGPMRNPGEGEWRTIVKPPALGGDQDESKKNHG